MGADSESGFNLHMDGLGVRGGYISYSNHYLELRNVDSAWRHIWYFALVLRQIRWRINRTDLISGINVISLHNPSGVIAIDPFFFLSYVIQDWGLLI